MATRPGSSLWKPLLRSLPDSDKLNSVSEGAEVLYVRLLAASDDYGRFYGEAGWIAAKLFTARVLAKQITTSELESRLKELEAAWLIQRYWVGGKQYLQISEYFFSQRKDVKPQILFPPMDAANGTHPSQPRPASAPDTPQACPEIGALQYSTLHNNTKSASHSSTEAPADAEPSVLPCEEMVLEFPVVGKTKTWGLTARKLAEYQEAYPGIDVLACLRQARQWCVEAGPKRKTAQGMPRFVLSWLSKNQNHSGTYGKQRHSVSDISQALSTIDRENPF